MKRLLRRAVAGALLAAALSVVAGGIPAAAVGGAGAPGASAASAPGQTPVFCYYYIWFDPQSWNRAKIDYPAVGRYSSSDPSVMRRQIGEAKAAGITAFLVSWKGTAVEKARLEQLAALAAELHFKLGLVYEGLDFQRRPLPATEVAGDVRWFARTFAADPVFDIGVGGFDRPLVIWSGSWAFSTADIAQVVQPVRSRLMVLASAKNIADYARVASLVEGDAYYWSSVNPATMSGYGQKLDALGQSVHTHGGLWIAPSAPGFDARLIGGKSEVPRNDGATLRAEFNTALHSQPDAIGLISWNEFSENTHIEPSMRYGRSYLDLTAQLISARAPVPATAVDSSSGGNGGLTAGFALALLAAMAVVVGWVRLRRGRIGRGPGTKARMQAAGRAVRRLASQTSRRWLAGAAVIAAVVIAGAITQWYGTAAVSYPRAPHAASDYLGLRPTGSSGQAIVAAAGDIACPAGQVDIGDNAEGATDQIRAPHATCGQAATAKLIGQLKPDAVLALGDTQYPDGASSQYEGSYAKSWGQFRAITYPAIGNHEYLTRQARGYFAYFGQRAGNQNQGWYSYDLAMWHVIVLNSECQYVGGCGPGSPQERWLAADLASHPNGCTLAYWHEPRWSSGSHGSNPLYGAIWSDLAAAGADVVLNGHDHDYERFAPLSADGQVDANGIREFIAGTGGESHYKFHLPATGSQVRIADTFGVLRLALEPGAYEWRFVSISGATLDAGKTACH
jgi:Glycosyl hydrolase family 99/Calcineurin-like phosphoesterase